MYLIQIIVTESEGVNSREPVHIRGEPRAFQGISNHQKVGHILHLQSYVWDGTNVKLLHKGMRRRLLCCLFVIVFGILWLRGLGTLFPCPFPPQSCGERGAGFLTKSWGWALNQSWNIHKCAPACRLNSSQRGGKTCRQIPCCVFFCEQLQFRLCKQLYILLKYEDGFSDPASMVVSCFIYVSPVNGLLSFLSKWGTKIFPERLII